MISPKQAREMRGVTEQPAIAAKRESSTYVARLAFKVEGAQVFADGVVLIPSFTGRNRGVLHSVDLNTMRCDCIGERIARAHSHYCVDVVAACHALAAQVLEIVGTPDADALADAADKISQGGGMMIERALFNGHAAARYGYTPSGRWSYEWSIGLKAQARRELTRAERHAASFILTEMMTQITAAAEAA